MAKREERVRRIVVWHLLALTLVLLGPTMLRLGLPFWRLPPRMLAQVPVLAIGYLATALFIELATRSSEEFPSWAVLPIGGVAFGIPIFLLLVFVGLGYSRLVLAGGVALGVSLAAAPCLLSARALGMSLIPLAVASMAMVPWSVYRVEAEASAETSEYRATALHNVYITYETGLVRPAPITGGGLDLYRDGFIVANGVGEFYRLIHDGDSLRSYPLDSPPLLNRDAFISDNGLEAEAGFFRVMDVLVDSVSTPNRVLVSHYHWNPDDRCVSMRVSAIDLSADQMGEGDARWETLLSTEPCIPWDEPWRPARGEYALTNEAGGRMAWGLNGDILFTVGGMRQLEFAARGIAPARTDSDYGTILRIRSDGGSQVLTSGHRNPEGLMVAEDGSIWSTEHGPRGGDELNLIIEGRHYGWPFATYGTEYYSNVWPLAHGSRDHGSYEEPVHAWVPSVGISNLIEVTGEEFPRWEGDFLVASLQGNALFRVRTRSGRAIYVERIRIGRRIRDLVEDRDGRILIWTDYGELVWLSNAGDDGSGEAVYSQCALCHESTLDSPATGPSLRGVWGRRAGSLPGYAFSSAFDRLDVEWSAETLDQFLQSPTSFSPGTTMEVEGLSEDARRSVIEFLRTYE